MKMATQLMRRLIRDETGSNAVEYVLILALISLVIVVAATTLGTTLRDKFQQAATDLGSGSQTP